MVCGFVYKAVTVVVESVADFFSLAGVDIGLADFLAIVAHEASDGTYACTGKACVTGAAHILDIGVDESVAVVVLVIADLYGTGVDKGVVIVAVSSEAAGSGSVSVAVSVDA